MRANPGAKQSRFDVGPQILCKQKNALMWQSLWASQSTWKLDISTLHLGPLNDRNEKTSYGQAAVQQDVALMLDLKSYATKAL